MNKIKKVGMQFLTACLTLIIVLTVCIAPVSAAEAPNSITVKRTKVMESYIGDNNGFTAYATTDDIIVYCMELIKKGATTGTSYTFLEDADAGLAYIMENGYPNKKITNRDEIDQYITQSAVWWYLDETSGAGNLSEAFQTTDKEAYAGIRDEIKALVNAAKEAKSSSTPTMTVTVNNSNLKITSDNKFYESDYIVVQLNGTNQYKVTLNDKNAITIDENGEAEDTFKSGEKFKIRINADKVTDKIDLTAEVKASATVKQVATYKAASSEFQNVVSSKIYDKNIDLTKTLTLSGTPEEAVVVEVPSTSANVPVILLVGGTLLILIGSSLVISRFCLKKN